MTDDIPEFDLDTDPGVLIEQLNAALEQEQQRWNNSGISTRQAQPDLIYLACSIESLIQLLIEKEVIEQQEANIKLKLNILKTMRGIRVDMLKSKLAASPPSGIIGPNGTPL